MKSNRVVIITGAASGLGLELCRAIGALDGYEAVGIDINPGAHVNYVGDVSMPEAMLSIAQEVRADAERIGDVIFGVVNCAGINHNAWFKDIAQYDLCNLMAVNAWSMVYTTQAFLDDLSANQGFVLNVVSNAANMPMTSSLAYNASKAAALMVTKQMAHELTKSHGITVFSLSPNKIEGTAMSRKIEANVCATRGWTPEYAAEYQKKSLMHGLESPPETIAAMIAGLIENGSWKYMSGCDIPFGK